MFREGLWDSHLPYPAVQVETFPLSEKSCAAPLIASPFVKDRLHEEVLFAAYHQAPLLSNKKFWLGAGSIQLSALGYKPQG
jgi:hypothetical protein